jgi:hypothetical protein
LVLELCLGGLQVHLPSSQAIHLLLKVVHVAVGTQVQQRELGCLIGGNLAVDVVSHARWAVVVDVVGVVLQTVP